MRDQSVIRSVLPCRRLVRIDFLATHAPISCNISTICERSKAAPTGMGLQTKRWPHACSTAICHTIKDIRRQQVSTCQLTYQGVWYCSAQSTTYCEDSNVLSLLLTLHQDSRP